MLYGGKLYVSAWLAAVNNRGPRGAVFQCDPEPGAGDCTRLQTPEDSGDSNYDDFGEGISLGDVTGDGNPELLVAAQGAGKGKNQAPARIFAYGLSGGEFDLGNIPFELSDASGYLHAAPLDGISYDEVFAISFNDGSGKVFANGSTTPFELDLVDGLTNEYGTNSDLGSLAGGETVVLVGGPGDPDGCSGNQNNGFAYLYVFDDPGNPLTPTTATAQSPTSDGADYGWDVSATGTNLVLISERDATVDGTEGAGQIHVYEYQRP